MWHEALGEPTIADGILDRLLERVHRIELHGESMRRRPPPTTEDTPEPTTDDGPENTPRKRTRP